MKYDAKAIEEMIEAYLPEETGHQKTVLAAMNYAVKAGGKRLRPMMLRLCYEMFAKEPQEALVRPFMAAMEMIHTYSLVHDDLPAMDNDALRRGLPTVHVKFGEDMAILAGDALLNFAFETACQGFAVKPGDANVEKAFAVLAKKAGIYGMVGGQVLVGRSKGVERPPLAPLIPTAKGVSLLIDCGANVDARPSHLVQFAKMGSIYMENVVGIKNPRVAIVNNGAEEEKGNALVKETFPLLKEIEGINFIGSIEARDIPAGYADVIVCEAFVGNVILKLYEGVSSELIHKIKEGMMTSLRSKIGALLVKPALKSTLKSFDASEYGGAPLLGLKGLVVKTHGSAKAIEIKHGIFQCVQFKQQKINEKIAERILEDQE